MATAPRRHRAIAAVPPDLFGVPELACRPAGAALVAADATVRRRFTRITQRLAHFSRLETPLVLEIVAAYWVAVARPFCRELVAAGYDPATGWNDQGAQEVAGAVENVYRNALNRGGHYERLGRYDVARDWAKTDGKLATEKARRAQKAMREATD